MDDGLLFRFELLAEIPVNLKGVDDMDRFQLVIDINEAVSKSTHMQVRLFDDCSRIK